MIDDLYGLVIAALWGFIWGRWGNWTSNRMRPPTGGERTESDE